MTYRFLILFLSLLILNFPCYTFAVDEENCLLCHRYSGLGRIDEEGKKHLYYINEKLYNQSVHGKIRCGECHIGINKFPHGNVKKVDCASVCHLVDSSSNTPFSHARMIEQFELSVHGKGSAEKPKKNHIEDLPTCTYCHDNRIYPPANQLQGISQEIFGRCLGCHTDENWTNAFYYHFAERLNQSRSSKRMVELCTSCHEDIDKMYRHKMNTVSTFRDTFHWQAIKYDDPNAPNCITCHAPVGYLSHEIMPKNDPRSAIYKDNLVRTCSNQGGLQVCHPNATPFFAQGQVHPYQFKSGLFDSQQEGLDRKQEIAKGQMRPFQELIERIVKVNRGDPHFIQDLILVLIKYFYMILIGGLIGFMIIHQVLDFFATRRELQRRYPTYS